MKSLKILITGATGFIGSHLAERLVKENYEVRVLVRNQEKNRFSETKKDSLKLLEKLGVEIFYGDLLDKDSLEKAVKGADIIFHLAAIARPMAIPDELYFKVNEEGTKNLLDACKNSKGKTSKIKKIIIMSSISAVGPTRDDFPVNEKTENKPVDVYGWSKLAEENMAFRYFEECKLPIVILRPPMVFGERDFEMLKLFKLISRGFFPIRSDNKGMEFLYAGNLVEACALAMKNGKNGEIYHISNGENYSLNQIIHAIEKANNKKISKIHFPNFVFMLGGYFAELIGKILGIKAPFKHDTVKWMTEKFWYSDISKARKELKYNPKISLEEGVRKTLDYYKEKGLI